MEKVQPLPETKKKNGYLYKLLKRTDKTAMYSQSDDKGVIVGYEVFRIIVIDGIIMVDRKSGKKYPQPTQEKFPGNEDFGKIAWAFSSEPPANDCFDKLESTIFKKSKKVVV